MFHSDLWIAVSLFCLITTSWIRVSNRTNKRVENFFQMENGGEKGGMHGVKKEWKGWHYKNTISPIVRDQSVRRGVMSGGSFSVLKTVKSVFSMYFNLS